MQVIIHYPKTITGWLMLQKRVLASQGDFILDYVSHMKCSNAKKKEIINLIRQDVLRYMEGT
jgi:hypothetical protein